MENDNEFSLEALVTERAQQFDRLIREQSSPLDSPPCERTDEIHYSIGSRGGIDGEYFIKTSRTPDLVAPEGFDDPVSSQTFGIKHGDEEIVIVDFNNNLDGTKSIKVNEPCFNLIDINDFFVTDFVEYPMMLELLYDLEDRSTPSNELMWLINKNTGWVFADNLPTTSRLTHVFYSLGKLCTLDTLHQDNGETNRTITTTNCRDGLTEKGIVHTKDGHSRVIDPESPVKALVVLGSAVKLLEAA